VTCCRWPPPATSPSTPAELEGEELVSLDYLATGISVHGHPMDHMRERLAAAGVTDSRGLEELPGGARVVVANRTVPGRHRGAACAWPPLCGPPLAGAF
jgi:hypothetical protein